MIPRFPFFTSETDRLLTKYRFVVDKRGVFQVDYGENYERAELQYNPVLISAKALAAYNSLLKNGDSEDRAIFLKQVEWLVRNSVSKGSLDTWEYHFDQPTFKARAPWISAMAQGLGLAALAQAHSLTGDQKYLECAERTLESFFVDTGEGGVRTRINEDSSYYEEVASPDAPSSKILNGFIFALSGLHYYWKYSGDGKARLAFDKGAQALIANLHLYDGLVISYYDLLYRRNSRRGDYNLVHVVQLLWLYEVTLDPLFLSYALKFYSYERFIPFAASSSGSSDPKQHGPERLDLKGKYWSHNKLPTWIELDLGAVRKVVELTFLAYSKGSTPRDYSISTSGDGETWVKETEIRDNHALAKKHSFSKSANARFIKLDITAANESKNVALVGCAVETNQSKQWPTPVTSDLSLLQSQPFPFYRLTDTTQEMAWVTDSETGWIVIDFRHDEPGDILNIVSGSGRSPAGVLNNFELLASSNLQDWEQIAEVKDNRKSVYRNRFPKALYKRYLRINYQNVSDQPACLRTVAFE